MARIIVKRVADNDERGVAAAFAAWEKVGQIELLRWPLMGLVISCAADDGYADGVEPAQKSIKNVSFGLE
jgi:hypothetical protein